MDFFLHYDIIATGFGMSLTNPFPYACEYGVMATRLLPKQEMRVRFPLFAS